MATTAVAQAYLPTEKSQEAILAFYRQAYGLLNSQWEIRSLLTNVDRAYMREVDSTLDQAKAKRAARSGDPTKFQNIIMPVVMPQVEAAVTYQQGVFLTGYPIFSAVASPGLEDAATQLDTLIGEQQVCYGWTSELQKTLRNAFKYNFGAVEVDWARQTTYTLDTDISYTGGRQGKPKQVIYEGNKITNLDMYNTFFDTRVNPKDLPEYGEFAGYQTLMSRIRLKKFFEDLPTRINVTRAFESGTAPVAVANSGAGIESYFVPMLNPDSMINYLTYGQGTDWLAWAGLNSQTPNIQYKNMFLVTTLYARILPSDFKFANVPGPNIPQVWKFYIVNNQVVVYAERMTNAHNLIPILVGQGIDDGLGYQTKSLATNVEPIQQITSALANSSVASRRRAISDRTLYDPSRISPAMINNDSPIAKIPVRPSAYGTPLSEAVYAFPFRDDQFQINSAEIQMYGSLANQISGQNPARQGQFVKGNKTRFEFAEVMSNANGRDQSTSLILEDTLFSKVKLIVKSNILQYQGSTQLYNRSSGAAVTVDPVLLRKANLSFRLSDGLLPSDKLIDGPSLEVALNTLAQNPAIGNEYNLGPMFSYLMKSRGANLAPFEKSREQVAFEQATAQWQTAVIGMMEQLLKQTPTPTPEQIQQSLPPQPKPEDYKYDPASQGKAKPPIPIIAQVAAATGTEQ